jgi:hypothetical protein
VRYLFAIVLLFTLAWLPAGGQKNTPITGPSKAGFTAPILLSPTVTISTPNHCDELNGFVKFTATIDAFGIPHTLKVLQTSDWRLVDFATELVEAQRFKPGAVNGSATAVAVELTVGLHTCAQRQRHPTGDNFYQFTLRAHPLCLATCFGPLRRFNLAHPWNVEVLRVLLRSAGA